AALGAGLPVGELQRELLARINDGAVRFLRGADLGEPVEVVPGHASGERCGRVVVELAQALIAVLEPVAFVPIGPFGRLAREAPAPVEHGDDLLPLLARDRLLPAREVEGVPQRLLAGAGEDLLLLGDRKSVV